MNEWGKKENNENLEKRRLNIGLFLATLMCEEHRKKRKPFEYTFFFCKH